MLRVVAYSILLICGVTSAAQPVLNNRYDMDKIATVFENVLVNDSCYYATGTFLDTPYTTVGRSFFVKIEFDGDLSYLTEVSNDTIYMGLYPARTLISTFDGGFASLADYGENLLFIKYSVAGDTTFTRLLTVFDTANNISIAQLTLRQENDSSFTCFGQIQNTIDLSLKGIVFSLSQNGDQNWRKVVSSPFWEYPYFYAQNLTKKEGGGYILSGCFQNDIDPGDYEHVRYHVGLIETDDSLNITGSKIYTDGDFDRWGRGLTQTVDGGYLFCGLHGQYNWDPWGGTIDYKGHLIKLNSDFSLDWEIIDGLAWGTDETEYFEIITLTDTTFLAVGRYATMNNEAGNMIKFDIHGNILWDSKIIKIPWLSGETLPNHIFYDVKQTPDHGFVMVGQAINYESTYEPIGQQGWLVKTDSFGCLVPNCQDVLKLDPIEYPVTVKTYPNPAKDILNIFYHDNQFSGQGEIVIYNLSGQELKRWSLTGNDMTYMLEVGQLGAGTYIYKITDKGEVRYTDKFVKE